MAKTFLHGLSLANFRGVGAEQFIAPFQEVNFFIGPNNAGKSTVLAFIADYLNLGENARGADAWARNFAALDVKLGRGASEVAFSVGVALVDATARSLALVTPPYEMGVTEVLAAHARGETLWLRPHDSNKSRLVLRDKASKDLEHIQWQRIWNHLTGSSGGSLREHWRPQTLERFASVSSPAYPKVALIPAIREVGPHGMEFVDYSGRGLIDKLAEIQSPPHDEQGKKKLFEKINKFLREVTDSPDATIEIPYDRRHILVHLNNRVLPLSALGTGIHEVLMIAAFCTLLQGQIVCIEEPEIHLHPILQRRLIRFLYRETTNQYFIATHSAALIDSCPASVFRVSMEEGETKISLALTAADRFVVCKELGYRASDILQANSIVWVEGPSDRIYINHWLKSLAPDLIEGIDYSVMFYGGRLLSHLTPTDSEVAEFISLVKLNRNTAILIDSDKRNARAPINATKSRVATEGATGLVLITEGREIENYLNPKVIEEYLSDKYGEKFLGLVDAGKFGDMLSFKRAGKTEPQQADKIALARFVAGIAPDTGAYTLRKDLNRLVAFIRQAAL